MLKLGEIYSLSSKSLSAEYNHDPFVASFIPRLEKLRLYAPGKANKISVAATAEIYQGESIIVDRKAVASTQFSIISQPKGLLAKSKANSTMAEAYIVESPKAEETPVIIQQNLVSLKGLGISSISKCQDTSSRIRSPLEIVQIADIRRNIGDATFPADISQMPSNSSKAQVFSAIAARPSTFLQMVTSLKRAAHNLSDTTNTSALLSMIEESPQVSSELDISSKPPTKSSHVPILPGIKHSKDHAKPGTSGYLPFRPKTLPTGIKDKRESIVAPRKGINDSRYAISKAKEVNRVLRQQVAPVPKNTIYDSRYAFVQHDIEEQSIIAPATQQIGTA